MSHRRQGQPWTRPKLTHPGNVPLLHLRNLHPGRQLRHILLVRPLHRRPLGRLRRRSMPRPSYPPGMRDPVPQKQTHHDRCYRWLSRRSGLHIGLRDRVLLLPSTLQGQARFRVIPCDRSIESGPPPPVPFNERVQKPLDGPCDGILV